MWALEQTAPPRPSAILASTPRALIAGLGAGWLAVVALAAAGWIPPSVLGIMSVTTSKGATRRLRSLTGRTASPFPAYRITHAASAQRP